MNQRKLFETKTEYDGSQTYRRQDPETSKLAADHVQPQLTALRKQLVTNVATWKRRNGAWPTAMEASGGNESLRKRAGECVKAGHLEVSGKRKCRQTGVMAQTYRVRRNTQQ